MFNLVKKTFQDSSNSLDSFKLYDGSIESSYIIAAYTEPSTFMAHSKELTVR